MKVGCARFQRDGGTDHVALFGCRILHLALSDAEDVDSRAVEGSNSKLPDLVTELPW